MNRIRSYARLNARWSILVGKSPVDLDVRSDQIAVRVILQPQVRVLVLLDK